jgi:hypothetical protein
MSTIFNPNIIVTKPTECPFRYNECCLFDVGHGQSSCAVDSLFPAHCPLHDYHITITKAKPKRKET